MFLRFIPFFFENFHAFLPVTHKNIEIRKNRKLEKFQEKVYDV